MPEFSITVVDGEEVHADRDVTNYYYFLMPPKDQLVQIITGKEEEKVPTFVRVRVYYSVELLDPVFGGFDIIMLDCEGNEFTVGSGTFDFANRVFENEVDITSQLTKCGGAQPFGLNGVKVVLRQPYIIMEHGIIRVEGTYKVTIKVLGTWGW